jgi:hypothetical protein
LTLGNSPLCFASKGRDRTTIPLPAADLRKMKPPAFKRAVSG